ncbi:hypothetical protein CVS40_8432 [Lucilia cuprina]|nr:hypothetical protein CVS40_8432 [Lucilia cuprina]
MVAIYNVEDDYYQNPKTLGDWVKNFRLKKMQMKRKLRSGGNLRVCAILSTALMTAELELRRKQQERFQKWLEFQTKINKNHELKPRLPPQPHQSSVGDHMILVSNYHQQQHEEEKSCKQSEEITNLWKCELSELDNFMRSISSSSNKNMEQSSKCSDNHDNNYQQQQAAIQVSS